MEKEGELGVQLLFVHIELAATKATLMEAQFYAVGVTLHV